MRERERRTDRQTDRKPDPERVLEQLGGHVMNVRRDVRHTCVVGLAHDLVFAEPGVDDNDALEQVVHDEDDVSRVPPVVELVVLWRSGSRVELMG